MFRKKIIENQTEAIPSHKQAVTMPRNQDGATERVCLKRKTMEPVGRTKFMRSFTKHEDKINEVLLEVMTATSEEKDVWDDKDNISKDLLNDLEDNDEIYEMQESNICNIAMVEPMKLPTSKGAENMGWTDIEVVSEQWTGFDNVVTAESDDMETSNCMSTLLCQGARGSVKLLRKSLNCMQKQDDKNVF